MDIPTFQLEDIEGMQRYVIGQVNRRSSGAEWIKSLELVEIDRKEMWCLYRFQIRNRTDGRICRDGFRVSYESKRDILKKGEQEVLEFLELWSKRWYPWFVLEEGDKKARGRTDRRGEHRRQSTPIHCQEHSLLARFLPRGKRENNVIYEWNRRVLYISYPNGMLAAVLPHSLTAMQNISINLFSDEHVMPLCFLIKIQTRSYAWKDAMIQQRYHGCDRDKKDLCDDRVAR